MDPASETLAGIAFGRFRLLPHGFELPLTASPSSSATILSICC
jgi:hypothetical protein